LIVVVAGRVSTGPVVGAGATVPAVCDVVVCPVLVVVDVDDWAEAAAATAITMAQAIATRFPIRSAS
jgi:hypothetical protein